MISWAQKAVVNQMASNISECSPQDENGLNYVWCQLYLLSRRIKHSWLISSENVSGISNPY